MIILSDSQAALQAILYVEIKSTMLVKCIQMLNTAATENNILLAYRGINKNELGELLAKKTLTTSSIEPESLSAVGNQTLREQLRKEERASSKCHWQQVPGFR